MVENNELDKIIYLLKDYYKKSEYIYLRDILTYSEFNFEDHWNKSLRPYVFVYNLTINTDPEVYFKYFNLINDTSKILLKNIEKISEIKIDKIRILPNLNKVEILNNEIIPVFTDWEEINNSQSKLLDLLKKSADSLDFQNIGNTSRTILQKLANIVFIPEKHTPSDLQIDVSSGKFKNQLHSYIKFELSEEKDKELRQFAEATIISVDKAIDLANTLTHKLTSKKIFAEVCVIGTIGVINIIKVIQKDKKK